MAERKRLQWQAGKKTNPQGKKIFNVRSFKQKKCVGNKNRFVFNITYHPVFLKLKNILSEIQLLLTPDREHGKGFKKIPLIGFRRAKSVKDILVKAKVVPLEKKKGCCRSCGGTRREICKHVVITKTLRFFCTKREYWIKPDNLNCCFSNVMYLFSCKSCSKQYTGSTENFWCRFNNYKSAHRNFIKGNTVKQAYFHTQFEDDKYHGMSD